MRLFLKERVVSSKKKCDYFHVNVISFWYVISLLYLYLISERSGCNAFLVNMTSIKEGYFHVRFISFEDVITPIYLFALGAMYKASIEKGGKHFHVRVISFFLICVLRPFQNISLISSRSFIKGGRKPENPRKNHLTVRKQNLAFPLVTRARLKPQRWET